MKNEFNLIRNYSNKKIGLVGFFDISGTYGKNYRVVFNFVEGGKITQYVEVSDVWGDAPRFNREFFSAAVTDLKSHPAFKVFK